MKTHRDTKQHVGEIADPVDRRIIAALRASRIGVFEFEPQNDRAFWDDRVRELWGIPEGEVITYETVVGRVHPDDQDLHNTSSAKAFDPAGDGHMDMVYRVLPRDGHPMRWVHAIADCFFENGEAVRLVGTVQDITAEKAATEHNRLLVNELEHRVKNTLATVIAIVRLSRSGATDIDTFLASLDERLRTLAGSQDLLRKADWTPVAFADLVTHTASMFGANNPHKIVVKGDPVSIPANNVMSMSMGINELFTNAVKYGGLTVPEGTITIDTAVSTTATRIMWQESGCPMTGPDTDRKSGFGTLLLEEILPAELKAKATRHFDAGTFTYQLDIPAVWGGQT